MSKEDNENDRIAVSGDKEVDEQPTKPRLNLLNYKVRQMAKFILTQIILVPCPPLATSVKVWRNTEINANGAVANLINV